VLLIKPPLAILRHLKCTPEMLVHLAVPVLVLAAVAQQCPAETTLSMLACRHDRTLSPHSAVDADHDRLLRRVQIQADDVADL